MGLSKTANQTKGLRAYSWERWEIYRHNENFV